MQNIVSIVRQPIVLGLLLSVAAHAAILNGRAISKPPVPLMETGRTVIQLTLQPSPSISAEDTAASTSKTVSREETVNPAPKSNMPETASAKKASAPPLADDHQGITSKAVVKGAFYPTYPRISRRRGEEGTVALTVQVLSDGSAGAVEVVRSSGYKRLDRAAREAAGRTHFEPALLFGRTIESTIELSYTYRLTDD